MFDKNLSLPCPAPSISNAATRQALTVSDGCMCRSLNSMQPDLFGGDDPHSVRLDSCSTPFPHLGVYGRFGDFSATNFEVRAMAYFMCFRPRAVRRPPLCVCRMRAFENSSDR